MRTLAQITNPVLPPSIGSGNVSQGGTVVGTLISNLVGAIFIFSFIFAFMYLIMGGTDWITSGGDKAKLEHAKDRITNAIIGLIIVAAAWALATLIGQFLGIDLKSLKLPTLAP